MTERTPITIASEDPRVDLLLTLADDELIMGHRLSEWTGWVPYLEGDLAFSSIAQDEIGHARALYGLAVSIGAADDEDVLALGRSAGGFRHATICSRPNGDFATSLARQWCYDRADRIRLDAVRSGSWKELTDLCAVIELEEVFHRAHADAWFERLINGPVTARHRFVDALTDQLSLMQGFFSPLQAESELLDQGILTKPSSELWESFRSEVLPILDEAGFDELGALLGSAGANGRGGCTDEYFQDLWQEMTALYRSEAEARW